MILDIFSELQRPQLAAQGNASRIYEVAIEQAKLADHYDFGCWWTVEHHGSGDFSYSSTPEIFLPASCRWSRRSSSPATSTFTTSR